MRNRACRTRELYNLSARLALHFAAFDVVSVTGYSHIDQEHRSSTCYDDPNNPAFPNAAGGASCVLGAAFGMRATPGQTMDELFNQLDNYRTTTQDLRLVSTGDTRVRWQVGASYLHRDSLIGYDLFRLIAPTGTPVLGAPSWNDRVDDWWGVYGQASTNLLDRLELTVAVRYDHNDYENTTYTDRTLGTVIRQVDIDGVAVPTLKQSGNGFQPKVQLSYHLTDDVMAYFTYSSGFRAGFFSSAVFAVPEKTKNYEVGIKSTLFDRRVVANAALFHIDYSNQQFSRILAVAPFRLPVTVPETSIDGFEGEVTYAANRYVRLGGSVGYLKAIVTDGTASPYAPKWTGNLMADVNYPITDQIQLHVRGDYRYQAPQYLGTGNAGRIGSKDYVNLRVGPEADAWSLTAYVKNLLDTREAIFLPSALAGATLRQATTGRQLGLEAIYKF